MVTEQLDETQERILYRVAAYVHAIEILSIENGLYSEDNDDEVTRVSDIIDGFTQYQLGLNSIDIYYANNNQFGIKFAKMPNEYICEHGKTLLLAIMSAKMDDDTRDVMIANLANIHFQDFMKNGRHLLS